MISIFRGYTVGYKFSIERKKAKDNLGKKSLIGPLGQISELGFGIPVCDLVLCEKLLQIFHGIQRFKISLIFIFLIKFI